MLTSFASRRNGVFQTRDGHIVLSSGEDVTKLVDQRDFLMVDDDVRTLDLHMNLFCSYQAHVAQKSGIVFSTRPRRCSTAITYLYDRRRMVRMPRRIVLHCIDDVMLLETGKTRTLSIATTSRPEEIHAIARERTYIDGMSGSFAVPARLSSHNVYTIRDDGRAEDDKESSRGRGKRKKTNLVKVIDLDTLKCTTTIPPSDALQRLVEVHPMPNDNGGVGVELSDARELSIVAMDRRMDRMAATSSRQYFPKDHMCMRVLHATQTQAFVAVVASGPVINAARFDRRRSDIVELILDNPPAMDDMTFCNPTKGIVSMYSFHLNEGQDWRGIDITTGPRPRITTWEKAITSTDQ